MRNLHDNDDSKAHRHSTTATSSSSSSTPTMPSKQLPPLGAGSSPGIHRGSIVPLDSTAAITSTNLLMQDELHNKTAKRQLKRTASERKAVRKGKAGKSGQQEKETEWIYEERELKIAICCVVS